jgi:hypothetical protein
LDAMQENRFYCQCEGCHLHMPKIAQVHGQCLRQVPLSRLHPAILEVAGHHTLSSLTIIQKHDLALITKPILLLNHLDSEFETLRSHNTK